jgi:hypothetical protein
MAIFSKLTSLVLASAALCAGATALPQVHPSVHRALRAQGSVNLIVTMKKSTRDPLTAFESSETFASRGERIENLVERLSKHALESQADLKALLSLEEASFPPLYAGVHSFWISNQVFIHGASIQMVEKLAALSSIAEIREEQILTLPHVAPGTATNATTGSPEWGVKIIQATNVWAKGNTGKGVVVATIDSGVLGTHEALAGNFRGAYGWYDPESKKAAPYDNNGHGTHTMGTIAGAGGIGVAPGVAWMACKGCRSDQCPESDLLACAQFITCPTDTDGKNKDCSKAPHVVSNSWGGDQGDAFFQAAVDAWRKAGIIPIFANGNSGPECTTANSPGDYANVIAVGATDSTDGLASFSSKGPSKAGLMKPEVSGPGVDVRSAWNSGDSRYSTISGTSMAAPHVSGAVALLLAAKPGLSFDQVKQTLTSTVDTASLKATGQTCGGSSDAKFPNNMYGYGRINVLKAIAASSGGETPAPTSSVSPSPTSTPTATPVPWPQPTPRPTTKAPTPCGQLSKPQCQQSFVCLWDGSACTEWLRQ